MKRRILFVIDSLSCGGAEKSLVSLLPLLDQNKMQVDLLIVRRGGLFESLLPASVHLVAMPQGTGCRKVFRLFCRSWFSFRLRMAHLFGVKRHDAERYWASMNAAIAPLTQRYDVAIAYHQGFPTYYVATKVGADRKYAWINTDLQQAGYRESFNTPFYACFDGVVAVSETLRKMLEGSAYVDRAKLCTVYDILNPDLIRRMSREESFGDGLPADIFRLVTVGRMIRTKNYALAVETAKRLKKSGLRFRWYFVGDGPERAEVERRIEAYGLQHEVILLGMQPNPYPYMAGCDVYVQTSRFEGFCLTLREARMLHKPVVSTNFPVVYDQIHEGENGLIAEMTAESVAEKILQLVHHPALREQLTAATQTEADRTAITEAEKVNRMLLS